MGRRTTDARDAAIIFIAVAAVGFLALPHLDVQGNHPIFDGAFYKLMAEHPGAFQLEPYSFRVLIPWTVWASGVTPQIGFAVTSVLGLAGASAILYLYTRTFVPRRDALVAIAFFILPAGVLFPLLDPWLVDGPTMFFVALTFFLVRRGSVALATVSACVGVVGHDNVLLVLAPLAVAHLVENRRRFDRRLIAFVALPVLVYGVLHYTPLVYGYVPPSVPVWDPDRIQLIYDLRIGLDGGLWNAVVFSIAASFGGIWMLALFGFSGAHRFLRTTAVMVPLVLLLPLAANDWERMLTLAFPVVIPLAACVRLQRGVLVPLVGLQGLLTALAYLRLREIYTNQAIGPFSDRHSFAATVLLAMAGAVAIIGYFTSGRSGPVPDPHLEHDSRGRSSVVRAGDS